MFKKLRININKIKDESSTLIQKQIDINQKEYKMLKEQFQEEEQQLQE